MSPFRPPERLAYSLPLTAIEEQMRMESLGIQFLCVNRCFHYLVPLEHCPEADVETSGQAPYLLYSYLYHPVTKILTRSRKTPISDLLTWERRARKVGLTLAQEDGNQDLWE